MWVEPSPPKYSRLRRKIPIEVTAAMSAPIHLQVFIGLVLFAVIFVPLERWFPISRARPLRPGWATDVTYYVVGCFVGKFSDAISVATALFIRHATGIGTEGRAAAQPTLVQFLEILLLADFIAYCYHRSLHRNPYLWRLHKVHHSSARMDWLANVRLHPIDKLLGDAAQFVPIFLLGFSNTAILTYTIFLGFQGFINHSNIKLKYGLLRWIVASPEFHHWHHYDHVDFYNKNFSPHLVIFDFLFGTLYLPPHPCWPPAYGLRDPAPKKFWEQIVFPFTSSASVGSSAGTDSDSRDAGQHPGIERKK